MRYSGPMLLGSLLHLSFLGILAVVLSQAIFTRYTSRPLTISPPTPASNRTTKRIPQSPRHGRFEHTGTCIKTVDSFSSDLPGGGGHSSGLGHSMESPLLSRMHFEIMPGDSRKDNSY